METLNYAFTFIIGIFCRHCIHVLPGLKITGRNRIDQNFEIRRASRKTGGPFKEFFRLHRN